MNEEEKERERKLVHRARSDILSRFRIVRYYRMRAPEICRMLPSMLHSTMRHLPPTEYCDFLRKLKSRGLHRSNDRPRRIVHTSMFARGRRLDEACFVTTSQGYHSHQIETGLCIRLTLFVLHAGRSLASHLYSSVFFRLVYDPLRDRVQ